MGDYEYGLEHYLSNHSSLRREVDEKEQHDMTKYWTEQPDTSKTGSFKIEYKAIDETGYKEEVRTITATGRMYPSAQDIIFEFDGRRMTFALNQIISITNLLLDEQSK